MPDLLIGLLFFNTFAAHFPVKPIAGKLRILIFWPLITDHKKKIDFIRNIIIIKEKASNNLLQWSQCLI
jgi:hypothetical protein